MICAASERWVVTLDNGELWLLERIGADMSGHLVTRAELAAASAASARPQAARNRRASMVGH